MAVSVKKKEHHKEVYIHGSAVSNQKPDLEPLKELMDFSASKKDTTPKEVRSKAKTQQKAPSVSLFAIIGFFVVSALMIFVMLAQVNYNEVLRETARLNTHLDILKEQQRVLSITFESVINMDEIERYAKDVLGMSKPEAEQVTLLRTLPEDKVEVIYDDTNVDRWREFSGFLTFLFDEYIR